MPPAAIDDEVDNDVLAEVVTVLESNVDSASDVCVYTQMEVMSND